MPSRKLIALSHRHQGPHQPAMYRSMDAGARAASLAEIARQLDVLQGTLDAAGPFACGPALCSADAALFPTFVFYDFILPRVYGWRPVFESRPRLARWWAAVGEDPAAAEVRDAIRGALRAWDADGRWDTVGATAQVAAGDGLTWAF